MCCFRLVLAHGVSVVRHRVCSEHVQEEGSQRKTNHILTTAHENTDRAVAAIAHASNGPNEGDTRRSIASHRVYIPVHICIIHVAFLHRFVSRTSIHFTRACFDFARLELLISFVVLQVLQVAIVPCLWSWSWLICDRTPNRILRAAAS